MSETGPWLVAQPETKGIICGATSCGREGSDAYEWSGGSGEGLRQMQKGIVVNARDSLS